MDTPASRSNAPAASHVAALPRSSRLRAELLRGSWLLRGRPGATLVTLLLAALAARPLAYAAQISFPLQCTSFTPINDTTREVVVGQSDLCDNGFFTINSWYRFSDINGFNFVPVASLGPGLCSTYATTWLSGSSPYPGATTAARWRFSRRSWACDRNATASAPRSAA